MSTVQSQESCISDITRISIGRKITYIGARTTSTLNKNVGGGRLNGSSNIFENEVGDGNAIGWLTGRSIISLIDCDTVVGDTGEGNAWVSDARDGSCITRDGLDTDT